MDVPLTPEMSPVATTVPHYTTFSLGQPPPAPTPVPAPVSVKGRAIILCFDGTGNKFGQVRFLFLR